MALDKTRLDLTGSGSKGAGARAIYQHTDNKATIKGAGYFNGAAKELVPIKAMLIIASDATFEAKVTSTGSAVTLAALDTYA